MVAGSATSGNSLKSRSQGSSVNRHPLPLDRQSSYHEACLASWIHAIPVVNAGPATAPVVINQSGQLELACDSANLRFSSDNVVHKSLETNQPEDVVTQRPVGLSLTATLLSITAKLMSGASIRWYDCQPDTCQRVYFANHTSHLDAVVLWSSLPRHIRALTRPVAARDYWDKSAFRRHIAGSLNALLIDRKKIKVHRSPVEMMIRAIGNTHSLIVFPEGGRNVDDEMGEFKSGLYYLSKKRPDLELVPVYVDNLNRVLPRGEFLPVPLLSCITIGPPMWLESGEKKVDFLVRARNAVLRLKDV